MIYHPDMNGGDNSKTEKFKVITSSFDILCKEMENRKSYESTYNANSGSSSDNSRYSNNNGGPQVRVNRRGERKPVSSAHYNVNAWQQAHFGRSAINLDSDFIKNHPSVRETTRAGPGARAGVNNTNTQYGFMKGMDSNKTFKYSQKLNRKDEDDR